MAMTYHELVARRQQIAAKFGSSHTVRSYGPFGEEALANMCDLDPLDTHPEKSASVDVNDLPDFSTLAYFETIRFDSEECDEEDFIDDEPEDIPVEAATPTLRLAQVMPGVSRRLR